MTKAEIFSAYVLPAVVAVLTARLENAKGYGLTFGDLWIPERNAWTRNVDGEQVVLEPLSEEDKVQYQSVVDELDGLQTALTLERRPVNAAKSERADAEPGQPGGRIRPGMRNRGSLRPRPIVRSIFIDF